MIDGTSETFGHFYAILVAAALAVAVAVRAAVTRADEETIRPATLDVYQLAWLVGRSRRVVCATLAGLAHREAIVPDAGRRRVVAGRREPGKSDAERIVWNAVWSHGAVRTGRLCCSCAAPLAGIGDSLRRMRLAPESGDKWMVRLGTAAVAATPAGIALVRLAHRLPQHRPVGLLALLCAVPVVIGAGLAARPVYAWRG